MGEILGVQQLLEVMQSSFQVVGGTLRIQSNLLVEGVKDAS